MAANPESIGRYKILGPLGEGGMGTVWLARDPGLERELVIKGLRTEFVASAEARERLLREARTLGQLDHPHIVQVHDLIEQDGRWYICMQRVAGQTLREVFQQGPLSPRSIHRILSGVASGLGAAHRVGIVHRDVKPENIIVTPKGEAKLLDFGVSWRPEDLSLTSSDVSVGTLHSMAPEQFLGQPPDHRSDLFSVGTLAYEMATGRHPFPGKSAPEVTYAIVNQAPAPPSATRGELPFELVHLISKCLEKDPAFRYQEAAELDADLRRLGRELDGGAPDIVAAPTRSGPLRGLKSAIAAEDLSNVPQLPPLPARGVLAGIVLLGILAAAALAFVHPAIYRKAEHIAIGPDEAERHAREFITRMGASPYGYVSATQAEGADGLAKFFAFLKLGESERSRIERLRPLTRYASRFSSEDRQDRFDVQMDDSLRLISLDHVLRPQERPGEVSADSAAALARAFARDECGLDLAEWESLSVGISVTAGRREREFHWRPAAALPADATANLGIRIAGDQVVHAALEVAMPPAVARALDDRVAVSMLLAWILFVGLGLAAAFVAASKRWYVLPSSRFVALAIVASVAGVLFAMTEIIAKGWVVEGVVRTFNNVLLMLAFGLIMGISLSALASLILGILSVRAPAIIPGLAGALTGGISRPVWARSAVVGLALGAVLAAESRFAPELLQHAGLANFYPFSGSEDLIGLKPFSSLPLAVLWMGAGLGGAMATLAWLAGWWRVGRWIWPIGVLILMLLDANSTNLRLQPPVVTYALSALGAALLMAVTVRFGLLAGALALPVQFALGQATAMLGLSLAPSRLAAGAVFVAWLAALAWSLTGLAARRPTST